MDPGLSLDSEARRALDATLALQADLLAGAALAGAALDTVLRQTRAVVDSLAVRPEVGPVLLEEVRALEAEARRLRAVLDGPGSEGIAQQETMLPLSDLLSRLYRSTEAWTGTPTADQGRLTGTAHRDVGELLDALRPLLERDLPSLRRALIEGGLPWPGGPPPLLPEDLIPPVER
jgi:hypothetical protein